MPLCVLCQNKAETTPERSDYTETKLDSGETCDRCGLTHSEERAAFDGGGR